MLNLHYLRPLLFASSKANFLTYFTYFALLHLTHPIPFTAFLLFSLFLFPGGLSRPVSRPRVTSGDGATQRGRDTYSPWTSWTLRVNTANQTVLYCKEWFWKTQIASLEFRNLESRTLSWVLQHYAVKYGDCSDRIILHNQSISLMHFPDLS